MSQYGPRNAPEGLGLQHHCQPEGREREEGPLAETDPSQEGLGGCS